MMSKFTKTIKLRIEVNASQEEAFLLMNDRYRQACNFVSEQAFNGHHKPDYNTLDKLFYDLIKVKFGLKSQLAQSVNRTVAAKYKQIYTVLSKKPLYRLLQQGKTPDINRVLDWITKPVVFKHQRADLTHRDYSVVKTKDELSIQTLGKKRAKCKIIGKKRAKCKIKGDYHETFLDGSWKLGTATLVKRNKKWFIYIPVSKDIEDLKREDCCNVVGVDTGIYKEAVTYDSQRKTTFYSGYDSLIARGEKQIEELKKVGTKSAKRKKKRVERRVTSWRNEKIHRDSKALVQKCPPGTVIVLEDLTGVRSAKPGHHRSAKLNRKLHSWSHRKFAEFTKYKAREKGICAIEVDPSYTSQRCPKCGNIHPENRDRKNHFFCCCDANCKYKSNDDRVAAMNIWQLGIDWVNGVDNPHFTKPTK